MPTQEETDKAAQDYLFYTDRIKAMKEEQLALQTDIDTLSTQRESLNKGIADTQAAMIPLREELLKTEDDIVKIKQAKEDAQKAELVGLDVQRQDLGKQADDLSALADTLQKRGFDLDSREAAVNGSLGVINQKQRALVDTEEALAKREEAVVAAQKVNDDRTKTLDMREQEVGKKLQDAEALVQTWTSAQAQARDDRMALDEQGGKLRVDLAEMKSQQEKRVETLKQLNALIPVMKEMEEYIGRHMGSPDAIKSFIQSQYPQAADAGNQGQLA